MLHTQKVALAVAGFLVAAHVAWSAVVGAGFGQAWLDFILGLHFIQAPVTVLPFNFGTAVVLWVIVAIVGYAGGFVFASIWNSVYKK